MKLLSLLFSISLCAFIIVSAADSPLWPVESIVDKHYSPVAASGAFVTCVNGGRIDGDKCICPIYYTGDDCSERQCPNSIGGTGAYSILPVNEATKFCDHCDTKNFDGLGCHLCQQSEACLPYAGRNSVCNNSIVIRGDSKQFQCKLNSKYFIRLMGDGRNITADIILNCSTADGTAFSEGKSGACEFAIYRVEPEAEYVDPFFRCSTTQCSMKYEAKEKKVEGETTRQYVFRIIRVSGQILLVILSVSLAVLGGFAKHLGYKRMRRFTLYLVVSICVTVVVYILLMMVSMQKTEEEMTVVYECKSTSCKCAEDPPSQYQPICSESDVLANRILPSIKNSIRFVCEIGTNQCQLTLTDLALVFEADCQAAECVDEDRFPIGPPNGDDDDGKTTRQQKTLRILLCLMQAILLCVAIHWMYMRHRAGKRTRDFILTFNIAPSLDGDEDGSSSSPDPEDTNADLLILDGGGDSPLPAYSAARDVDAPSPHSLVTVEEGEDDTDERDPLCPRNHHSSGNNNTNNITTSESHRRDSVATVRDSIVRDAAALSVEERMRIDKIRQLTRSPLTLTVDRLRYSLLGSRLAEHDDVGSRVILNQINFSVHSGEVLAIMGPSGAGKTTLLDLLSARAKSGRASGSVLLNGTPIRTDSSSGRQYRNIIGYVSQEDTLLPTLTVRQTIEFAARLKLPKAFSRRTIEKIVARMIIALKLQRCENTLVGDGASLRGISGGEKRRVSIAVELLANPRILYLDEPTSGLDTVSAKRVVEAVVELAKDSPMRRFAPHYFAFRPIVIFSIHQPSQEIFELFDKILLLSRGVSVYCGAARVAAEVFENRVTEAFGRTRDIPSREEQNNPAEYLMKLEEILDDNVRAELQVRDAVCNSTMQTPLVAAGGFAGALQQQGPDSIVDGDAILVTTAGFRKYYANVYEQLALLTSRSVACMIGSFHLVVCHSAVVACLASLMCFLYHEQALDLPGSLNRAGSVSFLLLVTSFVSLSCLEQLILERKLLSVERENGFYSTFPYLLSKVAVDIIPLRVIPAVVLASVIYFPMGFRVDDGFHFLWFIVIIVLFSISMTLMVLCIGIVSGSFGAAALLSSVFILWNFVFGGAMVQAETIPSALKPFKSFSPFFLAFESLMVNELNGQACVFSPTDETGKSSSASIPIMCVQYLANVGLKPERFGADVMQLGIYCFFLVILAWFLLATCTRLVR